MFTKINEFIMKRMEGNLNKALNSAYDIANAGAAEIRFPDVIAIWGGVETPLLARTAGNAKRARAITHRWRAMQVRAPAENAQKEGVRASDLSGRSVSPVSLSNTCQNLVSLIEVTDDMIQEAKNGVYGADYADPVQKQIDLEIPAMVADLEWSMLYSVEVDQETATEAAARKMAGLIGTVGSFDDGLLTTTARSTVTDLEGAVLDQDAFDAWLGEIAAAGAGAKYRPTAVYCSLAACQAINTFESMVRVTVNVNDPAALATLTAGQRVSKYIAPWGGILDIVWEPQNAHDDGTAANNWMAALCEHDIAPINLYGNPEPNEGEGIATGGFIIEPQPKDVNVNAVAVKASCCIEVGVFKAHGVLHNFATAEAE